MAQWGGQDLHNYPPSWACYIPSAISALQSSEESSGTVTTSSQSSSTGLCFMAQLPQGLLQGMGMSGKGRAGEHCENTVSALHFAHSCVRNPQHTLGTATLSHAKPNSAREKLSFYLHWYNYHCSERSQNRGHESQQNKGSTLLQEISSPVLSVAAARGHCELAAADGEKVLAQRQPTVSRAHSHV